MIKISIIIPHRNSFHTLLRLLDTIPDSNHIETVIVDDKSDLLIIEELKNNTFRNNVKIIFNDKQGGAGSARNIGLNNITGKWVIFADSDDYFSKEFLEITSKFLDNNEDIIYFGTNSITELGNQSYRHLRYVKLVDNYLKNQISDMELKFCFLAPWGKMIKRNLIEQYKIRFETFISGEDNLFSLKVAHNAKRIKASSNILYYLTHTNTSLNSVYSKDHFTAKFQATLQANRYLCAINQKKYQISILYFLGRSSKFGLRYFIYTISQLVRHQSNILIGIRKILDYKNVIKMREHRID